VLLLLLLLLPVPCGLQVFTNDAFYASNHRVLKSVGVERYSRAFFFNPSFKADIAPSPQLTIAGGQSTMSHCDSDRVQKILFLTANSTAVPCVRACA
jgi:isopenicillin N synthase-like dioxygenase